MVDLSVADSLNESNVLANGEIVLVPVGLLLSYGVRTASNHPHHATILTHIPCNSV